MKSRVKMGILSLGIHRKMGMVSTPSIFQNSIFWRGGNCLVSTFLSPLEIAVCNVRFAQGQHVWVQVWEGITVLVFIWQFSWCTVLWHFSTCHFFTSARSFLLSMQRYGFVTDFQFIHKKRRGEKSCPPNFPSHFLRQADRHSLWGHIKRGSLFGKHLGTRREAF